MSYYDPWTHAIKIFFNRLLLFVIASLVLGLLARHMLLRWYLEVAFMDANCLAIGSDSIVNRAMSGLCLVIGMLLTAWLFTWLMMKRPLAHERHHRGARVVYHDEE